MELRLLNSQLLCQGHKHRLAMFKIAKPLISFKSASFGDLVQCLGAGHHFEAHLDSISGSLGKN